MRGIRSLITDFSMPRLSRWLIVASVALLTGWLQAHLVLAALHDDGGTLRNALTVYNSGEVRGQVGGAMDWVFDQSIAITGSDEVIAPVQQALGAVIASGPMPVAGSEAIIVALLAARDDALGQFDSTGPTHALVIEMGPILHAFGVDLPPEAGAMLGISGTFGIPVIDATGMASWRIRYHWATLLDTWGLLAGAVAGVLGILLARRPLRAFAIWLMVGGAVALLAIPLFGLLHDWLLGGGVGAWTPLIAPLVTSAVAEISPWLLPLGIAALIAGVGLFGFLIHRDHSAAGSAVSRTSTPREQGAASPLDRESTVDQPIHDERATRASTP